MRLSGRGSFSGTRHLGASYSLVGGLRGRYRAPSTASTSVRKGEESPGTGRSSSVILLSLLGRIRRALSAMILQAYFHSTWTKAKESENCTGTEHGTKEDDKEKEEEATEGRKRGVPQPLLEPEFVC